MKCRDGLNVREVIRGDNNINIIYCFSCAILLLSTQFPHRQFSNSFSQRHKNKYLMYLNRNFKWRNVFDCWWIIGCIWNIISILYVAFGNVFDVAALCINLLSLSFSLVVMPIYKVMPTAENKIVCHFNAQFYQEGCHW